MAASNHVHEWARQTQFVAEATYGTDPGSGYIKLKSEARPTIDPGYDVPQKTGNVGRGLAEQQSADTTVGLIKPSLTGLATPFNELLAYYFLTRLFQSIPSATGAGPYVYDWNVYTAQPGTALGLTWLGTAEPATTNAGEKITGGVVTGLKISGSDGGKFVMIEPTIQAQAWANATVASASTVLAPALQAHFWNMKLGIAGTNAPIFAFDLAMNTGLDGIFQNNQTRQDWPLGMWIDTGSFTITGKGAAATAGQIWALRNDLNAGTVRKLTLEIGTAATAGYMKWERDVQLTKYTGGKTSAGIETAQFAFETAYTATTSLVEIVLASHLTT